MKTEAEKIEARKIYKREWNRANKDKVAAAQKRYNDKKILQAAVRLITDMGYSKAE